MIRGLDGLTRHRGRAVDNLLPIERLKGETWPGHGLTSADEGQGTDRRQVDEPPPLKKSKHLCNAGGGEKGEEEKEEDE